MGPEVDTSSNAIWESSDNYEDWETTRPLLFRDDMRDAFFRWFRIKPSDKVLDGGCATGVLTRFIAKGLDSGTITGFDISQNYVDYGNQKIHAEGLSGKAKIVKEDGFALSFADDAFDAVVNHAYLGVLSDNMAGLRELIRVCRVGGHISTSVSSRSFPSIHWAGDSPFAGEPRLNDLIGKQERIYQKIATPVFFKQDAYWNGMRFPRMYAKCGLKGIEIHPYASGFSYNDSYWTDNFKKSRIYSDIGCEIAILEKQRVNPQYAEYGFTQEEFDELIALYRQKQDYLLSSMYDNDCWEWDAKMHYIVTGTKMTGGGI
ncbi:MAG: class I SAM-dependent methyltransferase [Firmicutes bacterium]|nr:class I SAM-dependent methyltransferase [Bacillota bacterium]